jgi:hypothetical protein
MSEVPASYRVENIAGRLIEASIVRLATIEDADLYAADVASKAEASKKTPPVLCADHRAANIYPPAVADRLALAFRPNNARFDRIAILVAPQNATLLMQLQRLTREAGSDRRKVFLTAAEALEHLARSLDAAEQERARAFLARPIHP